MGVGWLGTSQPADLIPLCVIPPSPLRGDGENGCVGFPALSTDLYLVWFGLCPSTVFTLTLNFQEC